MSSGDLVLVDTVVWADHIDHSDDLLHELLRERRVLMHPFVIGELAMGNLKRRALMLRDLHKLPAVEVATEGEMLRFVEERLLFGRGIGFVDAHLLAAVQLTAGAKLWTRDRRLRVSAEEMGIDFKAPLKN